jgi:hypothetical protein
MTAFDVVAAFRFFAGCFRHFVSIDVVEHSGAREQLLENLDLLLAPDRKLPHRRPGIDGEAKPIGIAAHALKKLGARHHGRKVRLERRHIFEHAHRRDERKILEDHADAKRAAIAWRGNCDALAVHQDVAGIGRVVAVQDFGERAFAGTVLAEERYDLASTHAELGDIVGEQGAEPLDDAARFEEGRPAIDGAHGRAGSALRFIRRTSRQSASLLCARPSRPADTITTAIPVRPAPSETTRH